MDEGAPVTGLADAIAINNEDLANRAPYGQSYVEWSANNTLTAEEFTHVQATAAALANTWMDTVLQQNDADILVTGMLYSGNAGAAGSSSPWAMPWSRRSTGGWSRIWMRRSRRSTQ